MDGVFPVRYHVSKVMARILARTQTVGDLTRTDTFLVYCALVVLVYAIFLVVYRLWLHPLAKFPGPKLAAITRYYEAYYDVWKGGMYIFKIEEMHEKYGWIYSIRPPVFMDDM